MPTYITTDSNGTITASADWAFPGSSLCPCDVVRYPDGRLYSADALPEVYSEVGTEKQHVGSGSPANWIKMSGPKPENLKDQNGQITTMWLSGADGEWTPTVYVEPEKPVVLSSDKLTDADCYMLGDAAYKNNELAAQWLCSKFNI